MAAINDLRQPGLLSCENEICKGRLVRGTNISTDDDDNWNKERDSAKNLRVILLNIQALTLCTIMSEWVRKRTRYSFIECDN